jgi:hypothetical protein
MSKQRVRKGVMGLEADDPNGVAGVKEKMNSLDER